MCGTYMRENPFYFPGMTVEEYKMIIRKLAYNKDEFVLNVLDRKVDLIPVKQRTRQYVFEILKIESGDYC